MDKRKRITAIYLGALLLDGIIEAESAMIEKAIHSLERAASQVEAERAESRTHAALTDIAAMQTFISSMGDSLMPPPPSRQQARNDAHNRRAQDNDTDPNNAS